MGRCKVPSVLAAINPLNAVRFFAQNQLDGYLVFGTVVLVITGGCDDEIGGVRPRVSRPRHRRPGPVSGCGPLAFRGRWSDRRALVRAADEQHEARPLGVREERQRHESVEHTE